MSVETEALDVEHDFRAVFDASPRPMLLIAADAPRYTMLAANPAHARAFGTTPEALIGWGVLEVFPTDVVPAVAEFVDAIRVSFERVLATATADQMPIRAYPLPDAPDGAPNERYWSAINAPIRDGEGRVTHILSAIQDVTGEVLERRSEEARALLMREVDHRARNALTIVQSVLRLTDAASLEEYKEVVAGRVEALARAQTSLARRKWEGASLRDVLADELHSLAVEGAYTLDGPAVLLEAEQVQPMSMIIHELATNACKYGALSTKAGALTITWRGAPATLLTLVWREVGGPPRDQAGGDRFRLAPDLPVGPATRRRRALRLASGGARRRAGRARGELGPRTQVGRLAAEAWRGTLRRPQPPGGEGQEGAADTRFRAALGDLAGRHGAQDIVGSGGFLVGGHAVSPLLRKPITAPLPGCSRNDVIGLSSGSQAPCLGQNREHGMDATSGDEAGVSAAALARVDEALGELIAAGELAGAVVLATRHGKVIHRSVQGLKDLETGEPLANDTIFRIYSMTKPVTAAAMMILWDQRLWSPDDPIARHLPEFSDVKGPGGAAPTRPPTMRELMTHTAGLGYGFDANDPTDAAYMAAGVWQSENLAQMSRRIASAPLAYEPGSRWRYSIGMDVQGAIIERLTGQSLPDFMRERIFRPLGMADTDFFVPADKMGRLATLYRHSKARGLVVVEQPLFGRDAGRIQKIASGGGGLFSTADDYARFGQMLLGKGELDGARILTPQAVALMTANHLTEEIMAGGYGVGRQAIRPGFGHGFNGAVFTDPALAGSKVGRGTYQWDGAAGTWFWIDPENDLVFVGMIQRMDERVPPNQRVTQALMAEALGARTPA